MGCLNRCICVIFSDSNSGKTLGIKENYVDSSMVCFHPTVLLATILLVGFTIFSANRKPVKMATAVSPIEALGYRSASKLKKTKRAGKSKVMNQTLFGATCKG